MTETNSRSLTDLIADIDEFLGLPPAPASPTAGSQATQAAAPAERNANILHVMFDTKANNFVGASLNGKLFTGAVAAHLSKDSVRLLDAAGEDLLGAKVGVPEERSQAAGSSQVAQDVYRYMTAQREGEEE